MGKERTVVLLNSFFPLIILRMLRNLPRKNTKRGTRNTLNFANTFISNWRTALLRCFIPHLQPILEDNRFNLTSQENGPLFKALRHNVKSDKVHREIAWSHIGKLTHDYYCFLVFDENGMIESPAGYDEKDKWVQEKMEILRGRCA